MSTAAPAIEVRGLQVRYGNREVIHNLDLTVEHGEFVTIVGRSGCGKSTLLNAVAGFVEKKGYANIDGTFGVIFQSYAVFPWLTVEGNIRFGFSPKETREQRAARLHSLLALTGLAAEAGKYPAELSGGQVQRIGFARALAREPDVLLMDEPFGALDTYTREKMQTWLLDVWERYRPSIVFVTHSIEEAIFLSDRIVVLADGNIVGINQVPFSRPRDKSLQYEPAFIELKKRIADILEKE